MNREDAFKLVGMLVVAWPNWKPTVDAMELYVEFIQPMPQEAATVAIRELITDTTREFAPPVGIVLNQITEAALNLAGYSLGDAEEAWLVVNRAIRFLGWYEGPGNLDGDSTCRKAVEAVGWATICHDENVAATRAHFMRFYEKYRQADLEECKQRLLAGQPVMNRIPFNPPALEDGHEK